MNFYRQGIFHYEFIPEGKAVFKEMYNDFLRRLRNAVRRKRPKNGESTVGFLFTKMLQHTFGFGQRFLSSDITDLAPADFYLSPQLKSALKGWRYCGAADIKKNVTEELKGLLQNGFQERFQHLYSRWQKCVFAQGEYFEGNVD